jgi:hypothetical protein
MSDILTQLALMQFQLKIIGETLAPTHSEDPVQTQALQQFIDLLPNSNLFQQDFLNQA